MKANFIEKQKGIDFDELDYRSSIVDELKNIQGSHMWTLRFNYLRKKILSWDRQSICIKMRLYKNEEPNPHYKADDEQIFVLNEMSVLLLEHAKDITDYYIDYLRFGVLLKEWMYFSEIECKDEEVLKLAHGHLQLWRKQGIRSEKRHLW